MCVCHVAFKLLSTGIARGHTAGDGDNLGPILCQAVDVGHREGVILASNRVAGVDIRRSARLLAGKQRSDGCGADFGLGVGSICRFWHANRIAGITEYVNSGMYLRFEGGQIDRTPAAVVGQAGGGSHGTCHLGWDDIQYICLDIIAKSGGDGIGSGIYLDHAGLLLLAVPFDHGFVGAVTVQLLPGADEQSLLGEFRLGIENDHLRFRFVVLQIHCDLAGTLVRSRWAAERIRRRGNDHGAAILHRFQLAAQQGGLRTRLPGMWNLLRNLSAVAFDFAVIQINTRRDDATVVAEALTAGGFDHLGSGINAGNHVMHHLDAVLCQSVIAEFDGIKAAVAAKHFIAQIASVVLLVGFDQRDLNAGVGHAQVLGRGGTAGTAADYDDLFTGAKCDIGNTGNADGGRRTNRLYKSSSGYFHCNLSPTLFLLAGVKTDECVKAGLALFRQQILHLFSHLFRRFAMTCIEVRELNHQVWSPLTGHDTGIILCRLTTFGMTLFAIFVMQLAALFHQFRIEILFGFHEWLGDIKFCQLLDLILGITLRHSTHNGGRHCASRVSLHDFDEVVVGQAGNIWNGRTTADTICAMAACTGVGQHCIAGSHHCFWRICG